MVISRKDSLLLVVDLQEKLAPAIFEGDDIIRNSVRLLEGARRLGVPAFVSEHYVSGLGPSVPAIRAAAVDARIFPKTHFSCWREPEIPALLRAAGRRQIVLTGAETHVCVLQTALDLLAADFDVFMVADAASSRTPLNRQLAFERLRSAGGQVVSSEMVLFEWLERGGTDEFRALLPLIK
ncbi:hydrolase [Azonexus sp. R2A61]|uniref:hydrolase n=1 Tax=Azonexus sp. R2A61 TaxID=2744443 RepID=UPI001F1657AA|nr:hydrolase [Azonexus sp. R2A61]